LIYFCGGRGLNWNALQQIRPAVLSGSAGDKYWLQVLPSPQERGLAILQGLSDTGLLPSGHFASGMVQQIPKFCK